MCGSMRLDGQGIRRKTWKNKFNNGNSSIKSRQMRTQEDTTQKEKEKKKSTKIR